MEETMELCLAGRAMSGPMGASISIPYFPWSPDQVANLTEEARARALEVVREIREHLTKGT